jgi:Tfp pilus assembly protein PilN
MLMNGVNLLPGYRVHARRVSVRVRLWIGVCACWGLVLAGAHVSLHAMQDDDAASLADQITHADAAIKNLEKQTAAGRSSLAEAGATLRARKAVGDQPDWGLLLATIAARLDQQAVLGGCGLEPAEGVPAGRRAPRAMIRPGSYTLSLSGLARTQDAATAIAISLERTGLFERVSLLEAKRATFHGDDAVSFRLECALVDPAAEVQ